MVSPTDSISLLSFHYDAENTVSTRLLYEILLYARNINDAFWKLLLVRSQDVFLAFIITHVIVYVAKRILIFNRRGNVET